jgi:hypothetical protein
MYVTAASWQGAVSVCLYYDDETGLDGVLVELRPWKGAGVRQVLYDGPVGGPDAWTTGVVTISTKDGPESVAAYSDPNALLVVTDTAAVTFPRRYAVTHRPTGYAVLSGISSLHVARQLARQLLALPVDWSPDTKSGLMKGLSVADREFIETLLGAYHDVTRR